jgi:predicted transcriptional regulator
MATSNKLLQYLVQTNKIEAKGLPHYGGKQYVYMKENSKWGGNVDLFQIGDAVYNLKDEEIEEFFKFLKNEKI